MTGTGDADGTSARTGGIDGDDPTGSDRRATDGSADPDADRRVGDGEAARHGARATLYGALGAAFCFPDEETLAALTDPEAADGIAAAGDRLGLGTEAGEFLAALDDATVEGLAAAYNGLFGVPESDTYAVVPCEGHYTTGSEVSEEQRRIATVVGLMEQFGVEPGDEFHERQDHVAAELELMQVVAGQRAVAVHEGDPAAGELAAAERTVLDEHLVDFVPALAHDVCETADEAVYRTAAALAEELVTADHAAHQDGDADGVREVVGDA